MSTQEAPFLSYPSLHADAASLAAALREHDQAAVLMATDPDSDDLAKAGAYIQAVGRATGYGEFSPAAVGTMLSALFEAPSITEGTPHEMLWRDAFVSFNGLEKGIEAPEEHLAIVGFHRILSSYYTAFRHLVQGTFFVNALRKSEQLPAQARYKILNHAVSLELQ